VIVMANCADHFSAGAAVVVMNPHSGGRVARFRLVDRAEAAGTQVRLTSPDQDAASLARAAIADGARVVGVAGGDRTVSAVAAVAAEARRPLVVIPAGTRNHFARDLGLNITNPPFCSAALADPLPGRWLRPASGEVQGGKMDFTRQAFLVRIST
jgi:hypothetical protein